MDEGNSIIVAPQSLMKRSVARFRLIKPPSINRLFRWNADVPAFQMSIKIIIPFGRIQKYNLSKKSSIIKSRY